MKYYIESILEIMRTQLLLLFPPWLIIALMFCLPVLLVTRCGAARFGSRAEYYQRIDARLEAKDYYEAEKFEEERKRLAAVMGGCDARFFHAWWNMVKLYREAVRRAEIEERRPASTE